MGTAEPQSSARRVRRSNAELENVSQEALGVSRELFTEADRLIDLCLLGYPEHAQSPEDFAKSHPGWQMERINGKHQVACIFYGEGKVVLTFPGSEPTDPQHWYRNVFQSRIGSKQHVYKPEFKDRDALLNTPELQRLAAQISMRNGTPEAADKVAQDLAQASVHGGWSGVFDKPISSTEPPDLAAPEQSFWDAIKGRLDHALNTQPNATLEVAGHSSGGALAGIASTRWMIERTKPVDALYTFGQPRVGGPHFRDTLHALLGKGVPPYYRFEMLGDPIPSLPPLRPEHFVHGGQWICLSHTGALIGVADACGKVVTAAQSAQAGSIPMSSQQYLMGKDKLAQFVRATEQQMDEIMKRWGGEHVNTDGVFSSITHTLLDLPAHFRGESGRVHRLTEMQQAVRTQVRKQSLRDAHSELLAVLPLGRALLEGVGAVKAAHESGAVVLDEDGQAALALFDATAQQWVGNIAPDNPGSSIIINRLANTLLHRDDDRPGPLSVLSAQLGGKATAELQANIALLHDAVSDYLDRNTSVMPSRSKGM